MENFAKNNPTAEDWLLITPLSNHINQKRAVWLEEVNTNIYKEKRRNYLRVGVYAYSFLYRKWDFFEDHNIYVSGWIKDTNTQNNLYYVGDAYGGGEYSGLQKNTQTKIKESFIKRGLHCNADTIFPFASYAHGEQGLISCLEEKSKVEKTGLTVILNKITDTDNDVITYSFDRVVNKKADVHEKQYTHYLMLLVQTNPPCQNCEMVLSKKVRDNSFFEQFIWTNWENYIELIDDENGATLNNSKRNILSLSYRDPDTNINSVLLGNNYVLKINDQTF